MDAQIGRVVKLDACVNLTRDEIDAALEGLVYVNANMGVEPDPPTPGMTCAQKLDVARARLRS